MFIDDLLLVPGAMEIMMKGNVKPVVFEMSDVYRTMERTSEWWESKRDMLRTATIRPPYDFTWWEWRCDDILEGVGDKYRGAEARTGICCAVQTPQQAIFSMAKMLGSSRLERIREHVVVGQRLGAWRFLICASFVQAGKKELAHALFCIAFDRDGRAVKTEYDDGFYVFGAVVDPRNLDAEEVGQGSIRQVAYILTYMMSLLHIKNVVEVNHTHDERLQKARERRGKKPFVDFRTLRVIAPKDVRRYHRGEPVPSESVTALHSVGGHYHTYLDEPGRRLFGKYHGRFWIQPHNRGSREVGEITKRYEVITNKGVTRDV